MVTPPAGARNTTPDRAPSRLKCRVSLKLANCGLRISVGRSFRPIGRVSFQPPRLRTSPGVAAGCGPGVDGGGAGDGTGSGSGFGAATGIGTGAAGVCATGGALAAGGTGPVGCTDAGGAGGAGNTGGTGTGCTRGGAAGTAGVTTIGAGGGGDARAHRALRYPRRPASTRCAQRRAACRSASPEACRSARRSVRRTIQRRFSSCHRVPATSARRATMRRCTTGLSCVACATLRCGAADVSDDDTSVTAVGRTIGSISTAAGSTTLGACGGAGSIGSRRTSPETSATPKPSSTTTTLTTTGNVHGRRISFMRRSCEQIARTVSGQFVICGQPAISTAGHSPGVPASPSLERARSGEGQ